jgi:hypothetical protein
MAALADQQHSGVLPAIYITAIGKELVQSTGVLAE